MTRVPVAYLFISADMSIATSVLKANTIQDLRLITQKHGDTAFLFDNVANPNFISFEHDFGYGGDNTRSWMTVKFADPANEFESRFFKMGARGIVKGAVFPKTITVKPMPPEWKTKRARSQGVHKIWEKEPLIAYWKKMKQAITDQTRLMAQAEIVNGLVVMYGIGDDLTTWAGPFDSQLAGADYQYNAREGKTIELKLAPKSLLGEDYQAAKLGWKKPRLTSNESDLRSEGVTLPFYWNRRASFDAPAPKRYGPGRDPDLKSELGGIASIHAGLQHAFRTYLYQTCLGQVPFENVVVLFPDFDKLLHNLLQDTLKYMHALQHKGRHPPGLEFGFKALFEALGFKTRKRVLSGFGLRVHGPISEAWTSPPPNWLSSFDQEEAASDLFDLGVEGGSIVAEHSMINNENRSTAAAEIEKEEGFFEHYFEGFRSNDEDFMDALDKILDTIKLYIGDAYALDVITHFENDIQLKDIWFKNGIIGDPNRSVVVFGDKRMLEHWAWGTTTHKAITTLTSHADAQLWGPARTQIIELNENPKYSFMRSSFFGDVNKLPDHFGLSEKDIGALNLNQTTQSVPIFKSGTKDANILSVSNKTRDVYFVLLNQLKVLGKSIQAIGGGSADTNIGGIINSFIAEQQDRGFHDVQQLLKYARNHTDLDENEGWSNLKEPGWFGVGGPAEASEAISSILTEAGFDQEPADHFASDLIEYVSRTQLDPYSYSAHTTLGKQTQPATAFLKTLDELMQKALNLTIDTLPFFQLSKVKMIPSQLCVVLVNEAIAAGLPPAEARTEFQTGWLSGLYQMAGFKHTISERAVKSSFSLVKSLRTQSNKDVTDIEKFAKFVNSPEYYDDSQALGLGLAPGKLRWSLEGAFFGHDPYSAPEGTYVKED